MSTNKLDISLTKELETLKQEGRGKSPERIIEQYIPPKDEFGPRYKMVGSDNEFIRLNSNGNRLCIPNVFSYGFRVAFNGIRLWFISTCRLCGG